MLGLFIGKERGTITVLATLLLIPTVFFTGFIADLIRIKAYSDMAAMAADSYGEAVIAEYDNLLKDLYGLFAVTQEEDGIAEMEAVGGAIAWDFDPSGRDAGRTGVDQAIRRLGILPPSVDEGSFMPMKGVNASLDYELIEDANLKNRNILATQINDFTLIRIGQILMDDENKLVDVMDMTERMEGDCRIVNKKIDYDDKAMEALEAVKEFYDKAKQFEDYTKAVNQVHNAYPPEKSTIEQSAADEMELEQEMIEGGADLSEDDIRSMRNGNCGGVMWDSVDSFEGAVNEFDSAVSNYDNYVFGMQTLCDRVVNKLEEFREAANALETELHSSNPSNENLKRGVETDLNKYKDLINDESGKPETYQALVDFLDEHKAVIQEIQGSCDGALGSMSGYVGDFLNVDDTEDMPEEAFDIEIWKEYDEAGNGVDRLYEGMENAFDKPEGDSKKADKVSKKMKNTIKENEKCLDDDTDEEGITKRNIPESFGMDKNSENSEVSGSDRIKQLVQRVTGYFDQGGVLGTINTVATEQMTRFFVTTYDSGMFTCRTTNVKAKDGEAQTSITGVPMKQEVNYLYRAELEYLLCGNNKTKENIDTSRNLILGFRSVMNYIASYSIRDVNNPIRYTEEAVTAAATPLAGIAVGQAMRFAFSAVETYADWKLLKDGDKVIVAKNQMDDLSAKQTVEGLLEPDDEDEEAYEVYSQESAKSDEYSADNAGEFKMDYRQYLVAMLYLFIPKESVLDRTGNLITLNMNNVKQEIPAGGELSDLSKFELGKAHTAVEAYCTVDSKFAVMPPAFAQQMGMGEIVSIEDNKYKYRVTRSY